MIIDDEMYVCMCIKEKIIKSFLIEMISTSGFDYFNLNLISRPDELPEVDEIGEIEGRLDFGWPNWMKTKIRKTIGDESWMIHLADFVGGSCCLPPPPLGDWRWSVVVRCGSKK